MWLCHRQKTLRAPLLSLTNARYPFLSFSSSPSCSLVYQSLWFRNYFYVLPSKAAPLNGMYTFAPVAKISGVVQRHIFRSVPFELCNLANLPDCKCSPRASLLNRDLSHAFVHRDVIFFSLLYCSRLDIMYLSKSNRM